jgi:glucose-6-phosphate isomerase
MSLEQSAPWQALTAHQTALAQTDLRTLFADQPERVGQLTFSAGDLTVDLSKHLVTGETLTLLQDLATSQGLVGQRDAMFAGERINTTENRSVLHTALRSNNPVLVDGDDVVPEVKAVLAKMARVADQVRSGQWLGATGKPIRAVVNIGIGGSDLGPLMATKALRHLAPADLTVRFVSNIDVAALNGALVDLDPETTMFVVASKTFTTIETMTNAQSARQWFLRAVDDQDAIARHFVAVSTNAEGVSEFGIDTENMFEFWDWVGGRYSVDAAIGFSLMCSIGSEAFGEFLDGFRIIDDHFRTAPLSQNVPVLSALIGVWYRNFWGWQTHAVLPYSQALDRFSAYLQQLDMESNGKRVNLDGDPVGYDTAPILWGEPGTNGQHAFYQLIHQGTTPVPCDFIGFLTPEPGVVDAETASVHHRLLFANLVAQSEALAFGKTSDEVAAAGVAPELVTHRTFPGNRPSTVITAPALTASVLGQLIALYEHRVFSQGAVWRVNSFDQWGVELGKVLATAIGAELDGTPNPQAHDPSTNALIERFRA